MDYKDIIKDCVSKTDFARKIGISYYNGTIARKINKIVDDYDLDISHFDSHSQKHKKTGENRKCPICGKVFYNVKSKDQKVCSLSCSNIMFPRAPVTNYRTICFKHHEKKCIICGEDLIVEVHHHDNNHNNNLPENLVPLCSTHHKYMHSRYVWLLRECVDEYVKLCLCNQMVGCRIANPNMSVRIGS